MRSDACILPSPWGRMAVPLSIACNHTSAEVGPPALEPKRKAYAVVVSLRSGIRAFSASKRLQRFVELLKR